VRLPPPRHLSLSRVSSPPLPQATINAQWSICAPPHPLPLPKRLHPH
jgi:hypothetical protein